MAIIRTSALFGAISGSAGNATYVRTPYGVSLRDRVAPRDPRTDAQIAARQRMAKASRAWKSMTIAQAQAWREYAASMSPVQPNTAGDGRSMLRPHLLFVELATRYLAVNPEGEVPVDPPSAPFPGDGVILAVERVASGVQLSPSQPNAPGVVAEVLLQPLASVHRRTYLERYRTALFDEFGASPLLVPTSAFVVAVAVRFIRRSTGQASCLVELGAF